MSDQRTHYTTTSDDVTISGTVHGEGPPLVFVQGGIGDGDIDWDRLAGHLSDRFTCYLPSMRGHGRSGDHPDLGLDRHVNDAVTYVDSIGEPVGLVGWSLGASVTLLAATQSDAVRAVAPFGPVAMSQIDEQTQAVMGPAISRAAKLAAEGKMADAVRAFARWPFTDDDMAAAEAAGYFEASAPYVPQVLSGLQQIQKYEGPTIDDPTVLGSVSVPVLVLDGAESKPFYTACCQHVVNHVPDARMHEIPGAGHTAQMTHPEAFAEALIEFFSPATQVG